MTKTRDRIKVSTKTRPYIYWSGPLPGGAEFCGVVTRGDTGDTGALIRLATGIYMQGNEGAIRSLPQAEVAASLAAARLGRLGGTASTPRKSDAARKNGRLGGRPRKVPGKQTGEQTHEQKRAD